MLIESGNLTIETLHAANITNDGNLNATTSVEANNIENAGKITSDTVLANNDLENNGNLNATTSVEANNITNAGEITSDTVLAIGDLTNSGSMNVATTNVGGNLIDNGTWQQTDSTEINFNGTDAQEFTPNPNSTYKLINVEKLSGILTIKDVLNVTNLQINSNVIFEDTATIENLSIDMSSSEDENFVKFAGEKT